MYAITADNLELFCYTNAAALTDFSGIVINFHGLNSGLNMMTEPDGFSEYCTQGKLLYVYPYLSPWNWMNDAAVTMTDRILDAVFQKYNLPDDFPVVAAGRSMGGQCALIYCVRGKYRPVACALNCPVCDMLYHYGERPDVPRTIYSACCGSGQPSLEAAIRSIDPMSLLAKMPRIPYFIAHCEADTKVNIARHSHAFIREMRALGHEVEFHSVPDRDHIDLTEPVRQQLFDSLATAIRRPR